MIKNGYKLEFSSKMDNIVLVEDFVDNIFHKFHIKEEVFGNVLVAVTEAANNAIIHGNKENESKPVIITLENKEKELVFTVKDEGQGFDYNNIPDPTAPENLEKPTGRGIFLMKQLSDKTVFQDKGSMVKIHFKLK